jgi:thioesterase domain-containing protein
MIDLKRFEAECRLDIPLLNAMQLSFVSFEDLTLTMEAPLAPNINNKGTAFGGSIASICLFGGWAVSTLAFIDNDIHNTEIVVFKNDMTT